VGRDQLHKPHVSLIAREGNKCCIHFAFFWLFLMDEIEILQKALVLSYVNILCSDWPCGAEFVSIFSIHGPGFVNSIFLVLKRNVNRTFVGRYVNTFKPTYQNRGKTLIFALFLINKFDTPSM